jgi:uncharacterized membrane protein YgcG
MAISMPLFLQALPAVQPEPVQRPKLLTDMTMDPEEDAAPLPTRAPVTARATAQFQGATPLFKLLSIKPSKRPVDDFDAPPPFDNDDSDSLSDSNCGGGRGGGGGGGSGGGGNGQGPWGGDNRQGPALPRHIYLDQKINLVGFKKWDSRGNTAIAYIQQV